MKITQIDCHVLLDPGYDVGSTSSSQDDIVVEIHTDEGVTGIGETDVNPWIARACIYAPGTHTMGLGLGRNADRPRSLAAGSSVGKALRWFGHEWPARCRDSCDWGIGYGASRSARESPRQALP